MDVQGRRVYPTGDGSLILAEGDYLKHPDGRWLARPPGNHTGDLSRHEVTEHEDGTITVSPSILIDDDQNQWHGHLIRGVWKS